MSFISTMWTQYYSLGYFHSKILHLLSSICIFSSLFNLLWEFYGSSFYLYLFFILLVYLKDENNNDLTSASKSHKPATISKRTPLPDVIEENEVEFPLPNSNQPILV